MIRLMPDQEAAINKMKKGCILNGGTGSGKSITAIAYYIMKNGGIINGNLYIPFPDMPDLYIITTAKKRNDMEWDEELANYMLSADEQINREHYTNKIVIDSWNNIKKYQNVYGAFFIFDEQHAKGSGNWVKAFLKITKKNDWILLSATPGDKYEDYIPVFIANGFVRNKTEFKDRYMRIDYRGGYPKVLGYNNTDELDRWRKQILVPMIDNRKTVQHHYDIWCAYDKNMYKKVLKERWNIFENKPIENATELCLTQRKIINTDASKLRALSEIIQKHPKVIIFYNFKYELEILKQFFDLENDFEIAEYNGNKHEAVPYAKKWAYLVNYYFNDGWNNTETDTIIFFSENYSYSIMDQAAGRIDRRNTLFIDLHYYHLKTHAQIDLAIARAIKEKKTFNERAYVGTL